MVINPKVSVIVPVYNSEKYLLKCFSNLYESGNNMY